jgi:transposase-like protein
LIDRGFKAPALVVADGALGFWAALRELGEFFKDTKEQRCWVHRIANVMDCFPKRLQPQVRTMLHEMMYADTKSECDKTKKRFEALFADKYSKGTEKLDKDWARLVTFYEFPAGHWKHIRTTNVIESSFATVKLRTKVTKGAGSVNTATAMAFKLLEQAQARWRRISAPAELLNVTKKLAYEDGVLIQGQTNQEGAA